MAALFHVWFTVEPWGLIMGVCTMLDYLRAMSDVFQLSKSEPFVGLCGTVVRWESACWCLVYEAEASDRDLRCLGSGGGGEA